MQSGSEERHSLKREQSAAIDIPSSTSRGKDETLNSIRSRSSTQDSKSTDSTPKDTLPNTDKEETPPERTHSPGPPPAGGLSIFERRYSEPVAVGEPCVVERGGEGKVGITWNQSEQQLVSSSLPSSAVAIQIEVSASVFISIGVYMENESIKAVVW